MSTELKPSERVHLPIPPKPVTGQTFSPFDLSVREARTAERNLTVTERAYIVRPNVELSAGEYRQLMSATNTGRAWRI